MKDRLSSALRHELERANQGYITALEAVDRVTERGLLLIGTARTRELRDPGIALTARGDEIHATGDWRPIVRTERGGTIPIVRAGNVARLAVFSAFGGDINQPFQRRAISADLLSPEKLYDLGTFGWIQKASEKDYELHAHRDLPDAINNLDPARIVGTIDIVAPGMSVNIPDEPGQFGLLESAETLASVSVRAGDWSTLGNIATYYYDPLGSQDQ